MPKVISYKQNAVPYFEGDRDDRIFILQSGCMILSSTDPETQSKVTSQVRAGEFFGVKSALGKFLREETCTAAVDSVVICLTVPEFEANFSNNKQIIMKMLRVFSRQLREIHKKTEAILKSSPENQVAGMLSVAKCFFEEEQYQSCYDICLKFMQRFPNAVSIEEIKKMFTHCKAFIEREPSVYDEYSIENDAGALKQFELPAFERFAKKYAPGQVIISEYEPGDTFYLIQKGEVQLLKCVNGVSKNLDILKSGEFFGEMAILDNSPRSATCMAKTSVKCLEFSKVNFETLVTGNPQLALNLLKLFCKRIYDQHRRFKILVIKDNSARISDVFLLLDEMNSNPINGKDKSRRINATISDIAHWAGLSYDVTKEEISKLSERHKVQVFDDFMVVEDIAEMKRTVDLYNSVSKKQAQITMRYQASI